MEIRETIGISIISALVASFLAYYFGFHQYLKQRKREEIHNTYIKTGIDKIIKTIDRAYFNCEFNFAKAMRVIEYLEKSPDVEIAKEISHQIVSEMKPTIVAPELSLYKLQILTGNNQIVNSWIIETIADYLRYNDYLRYDLFLEIEHYLRYPERFQGKKKIFFEELKKRITECHTGAISLHESLKAHLLNLKIRVDEIGVSAMKDLDKVSKDKKVKEILTEVERDYKKIKQKNY
jgi:hypothetical protein